MDGRSTFELRRQSDCPIYTFDRSIRDGGAFAYKRRDRDFWIVKREGWGRVAWDDTAAACLGRSGKVLPQDQGDRPLKAIG